VLALLAAAHTVQQHFKTIFTKPGINRRRELLAREPVWT